MKLLGENNKRINSSSNRCYKNIINNTESDWDTSGGLLEKATWENDIFPQSNLIGTF